MSPGLLTYTHLANVSNIIICKDVVEYPSQHHWKHIDRPLDTGKYYLINPLSIGFSCILLSKEILSSATTTTEIWPRCYYYSIGICTCPISNM